MDKNGYNPSIIDRNNECFFCHIEGDLVRHEIFHGANRTKSKALGCWVHLCPRCHMKLHQRDASMDWSLKRYGQIRAMTVFNWTKEDFIAEFGRNYI